jgi:hypothetical protein
MGVKQEPWWSFLKFEHQMVPLLHCLIGIRNNLVDIFCDMIDETQSCQLWHYDVIVPQLADLGFIKSV